MPSSNKSWKAGASTHRLRRRTFANSIRKSIKSTTTRRYDRIGSSLRTFNCRLPPPGHNGPLSNFKRPDPRPRPRSRAAAYAYNHAFAPPISKPKVMDPSIFSTILIRRHVLPRNDIHVEGLAPHLLRQGTHGPAGLMALGSARRPGSAGAGAANGGMYGTSPGVEKAARELKRLASRGAEERKADSQRLQERPSSPQSLRRMQSTGSYAMREAGQRSGPPSDAPPDLPGSLTGKLRTPRSSRLAE